MRVTAEARLVELSQRLIEWVCMDYGIHSVVCFLLLFILHDLVVENAVLAVKF